MKCGNATQCLKYEQIFIIPLDYFVHQAWQAILAVGSMYLFRINFYHLVYMNTSILLVESQVILNRITGFKSKNILKCAFKAKRAVRMIRLARVCIKGAPSNG